METKDIKQQYQEENLKKPHKKDEISPLKKLNHKLGIYLSPKTTKITEDEQKFKGPGDDRSHRGADDLQPGEEPDAEDEDIVEAEVEEEGDDGADQRDLHMTGAAQQVGHR